MLSPTMYIPVLALLLLLAAGAITVPCGAVTLTTGARCRERRVGLFAHCHSGNRDHGYVTWPDGIAIVLIVFALGVLYIWFQNDGLMTLLDDATNVITA